MTRDQAIAAFAALDKDNYALVSAMRRNGYEGDGNNDDVCKFCEMVFDRIAKTSAATLATMTDWQQVLDHASGKDRVERRAADLPADIIGKRYRVEYNGPANRVQFVFDRVPSESARKIVKDAGFYWSPTLKCWQRRITNKARHAAEEAARELTAMGL